MERKTKIIIGILIILFISTVGVNLFLSPSSINGDGNITISDMANRTVNIPSNINKVVATSPPMTTMVYMLAPEKLTAVNFQWTSEELTYVPLQYQNLPVVGGWFGSQTGNYEEFIASEPNIIIESIDEGEGFDIYVINERQKKFGTLPVVGVVDSTDVVRLSNSIEFTGKLLNCEEKANKLSDFNKKYLNKIKEVNSTIPDNERKTVYYASGEDGLETSSTGSSHSQLINLCGGKNVADDFRGDGTSNLQVSIEEIIKWNPDVIICTDSDFYNKVYNDSNWGNIKAVKNKEVYLSPQSPFKWFDRPTGANRIIGVPWTAKVIYPDKYSDINLKEATQEFYKEFYHFDLSDSEVTKLLKNSGLKEKNI